MELRDALASRLTRAALPQVTRGHRYDAGGNRVQQSSGNALRDHAMSPTRNRLTAIIGSADSVYHYDDAGRLLSKTTSDGRLRRDYVWLGEKPIALGEWRHAYACYLALARSLSWISHAVAWLIPNCRLGGNADSPVFAC